MSDKKLFLLDGHALVYRAHYAFITRPLINSKGLNTSAITGMTRFIWDVIRKQQPTHIAVAFDLSGPTFRTEMYPEYKANREAQPEDITIALPYIREIIEGFRIPVVTKEGYEADDVIGTLAKQAEKEGFEVFMVTPDKDYAQLVSDKVFMYKPARMGNAVEILGEKEVLEKWQIKRVDQVIDVLGLQGDAVDNIPGIPGIGAKTAVKLLAKFDSMEGLLANTDQLKGKQKEKVIQFAEQGRLSKQLATIDLNVPIQFDAERYIIEEFDKERLSKIFKELEFRTLAKSILGETAAPQAGQQGSLFGDVPAGAAPKRFVNTPAAHSVAEKNIENTEQDYKLTDTPEKRKALIDLLTQQKSFCFDTETTSIDANSAELVGIAFSMKSGEAFYVPIPADDAEAKAIVAEFKIVLEDEKIEKVGQNLKYDCIVLKWYDIEVAGTFFDTMLAHYLIEPEMRHGMDYLAETYLKYQPVSITTLIGKKGKNQMSMRQVPIEKVVDYAAEDADITLQLGEHFRPKLKEEGLEKLYSEMEEPLMKVLVDLEYNGINLDVGYLEAYSKELDVLIKAAQAEIYKDAGAPFNISSPKQVGQVLFEKMELPYRWRKTKSGQYSTSEEKLAELAADFEIVNKILKYRSYSKLKSTYVDALPNMVNPRTGRVHSSFNQALTATGRLSSNNPNLQNIPIRTPEGRKVREAFIPRSEDYILLAADYSQIELRLIAELSGDEAMLEAFQKGQDIHQATAARVYDKTLEEVTPDERRNAKTVNFSIIYGAGATNLSQQLDIPRKEASELIKKYFARYQGLKTYMDKVVEKAREDGYVTTLMGRRRHLRDINSKNGMIRSHAERNAVNTPIQGTAADMIKMAMIKVQKALKDGNFKTKMILQVHDELVFDMHKSETETVMPIIEKNMKEAMPGLKVPILVGMDTGANWLEAH
ncbi:MAG: DNA polymerase I [Saprospiraceae bacterium]